ncbi:MAG: DUF3943 domain-containing protein [Prevotella sp.]
MWILIGVCLIPQTTVAEIAVRDSATVDSLRLPVKDSCGIGKTLFELPYSVTGRNPDWHRLWINTATLCGAFVGSLLVLECLPEDATSWNRAELQDVPLFKRWHNHVIRKGPEWDHDKFYFNYILHPYAGATYYMAARSCGFNAWQSLLYCTCISTIGWEFGIEAFMERPSIQDIFITPLVGSAIGEMFYKLKRNIVANGYQLGGSSLLGNITVFLIDPVNEVIGLFAGNPCREQVKRGKRVEMSSSFVVPSANGTTLGMSLSLRF